MSPLILLILMCVILYYITHKLIYLIMTLLMIILFVVNKKNYKMENITNINMSFIKNMGGSHTISPVIIDTKKPYLWMYWEIRNNKNIPPYIQLCLKIIKKNSHLFNLVILDNNTIFDYLPDLRKDINDLPLPLKADYIRILLLYNYGGLWLDCDVIMMTDMKEVVNLLKMNTDYIGFGCTGYVCTNGYGYPSNWAMGTRKNSLLMKKCKQLLDIKLNEYFSNTKKKDLDYHELGKLIIWECLDDLIQNHNYNYHHFPSYVDGTRDKNGFWIALELIMKENINLLDESKLMVVSLVNSAICSDDPIYSWFCKLSENEILNGDYFVTKLFKRAIEF